MKRMRMVEKLAPLFLIVGLCLLEGRAEAIRPFVTDDARIADQGQLELEIIPDLIFPRGERALFEQSLIASFGILPSFELGVGGAIGINHGDGASFGNPVLSAKLLFIRAYPSGIPGVALVLADALPYGRGVLSYTASALSLFSSPLTHLFT